MQVDVVCLSTNNDSCVGKTMKKWFKDEGDVVAVHLVSACLLARFLDVIHMSEKTCALHKLIAKSYRVGIERIPKVAFRGFSFLTDFCHPGTLA